MLKSRSFLPERTFAARRTRVRVCSGMKSKSVSVISDDVIWTLEQSLVASRGKPRTPAQQAGPTSDTESCWIRHTLPI